jgi:YEATS domain-containing protein 4
MAGVSVSKPFLYGNATYLLGQKEGDNSHRWVLYVRGLDNEDLSYYVKSVTFRLHESFAEPIRVLTVPPYEVSELGWGEFTVQITITFIDALQEQPVTLQHHLRLFGEGAVAGGDPLIFEKYDETVFVNPMTQALPALKMAAPRRLPETALTPFFARGSALVRAAEARQVERLAAAQSQIQRALEKLRARLYEVDTDIADLETAAGSA